MRKIKRKIILITENTDNKFVREKKEEPNKYRWRQSEQRMRKKITRQTEMRTM